jgi:pimeloyl-ACP methyl ester carboxylesterase
MTSRPELCRCVAELIPGARFEVLENEAHQPFQEIPDKWNDRVDAFWHEVEVERGSDARRIGDRVKERLAT